MLTLSRNPSASAANPSNWSTRCCAPTRPVAPRSRSSRRPAPSRRRCKKVAAAPADEKAALIAQTKELSAKVAEYKAAADAAAGEYTTAMWKLSNVVEPEAPEGGEDDYVVVKKVGQPRDFAAEGFEPKDHLTLGTGVAGIDMRRGVKVGGSRFYFLRGAVARMQIAMLTMAVDQAEKHGFVLAITPTLVRPEVMAGTGFLNSHADEIYRLREPDEQ